MPTRPASAGDVGQDRRRTTVVTRLVTLALMAGAALVVVSATAQNHGEPRARVAANTSPSVVLPARQPTLVRIMSAEQRGDAILLRVDPVGAQSPQTMVVSPGARVAGSTLQALLAAAADPNNPMHRGRFSLRYDDAGAIVAIAPA